MKHISEIINSDKFWKELTSGWSEEAKDRLIRDLKEEKE